MIVEDEALIAMTVAQYVTSYGYEVVGPFGKVSQALSSLQEQPVDAAVLDVQLDREIVFPVAVELTEEYRLLSSPLNLRPFPSNSRERTASRSLFGKRS